MPGSFSSHPGSVGFQSRSPAKEGSFLQQGTSADETEATTEATPAKECDKEKESKELSVSPPPAREGVPIRR